jgi:hypothetical protein
MVRRKSNKAIKSIKIPTTINTTTVDPIISFREGHVTRFNSAYDSLKNVNIFLNTLPPHCHFGSFSNWQARLDSNQQHPVLETGALAVRATGLQGVTDQHK